MASDPITSWQIDGETMETVKEFIFLGSKITAPQGSGAQELGCPAACGIFSARGWSLCHLHWQEDSHALHH